VLRGHWHNIIVVNVHVPSEEKSDESKESFYEELEQVFDHLPKCHMKMLLRDFNAKVGRENIFNQQRDRRVSIRIVMIMGLD
jgi:exonuclease III